jgi:mono/diheme cytochrome c family protein
MHRVTLARIALVLCLSALALADPAEPRAKSSVRPVPEQALRVTPVEGPSNFHRVGIDFRSSGMGRTGELGPTPESYVGPPPELTHAGAPTQKANLTGADLYRLSCQGCHRADGNGYPPEIPAITGPVQAMSPTLMERRMAERGRPITAAYARELTSGSRADLLNRLKHGGQKMPSFGYLTDAEVSALIAYLDVVAKVPEAPKSQTVSEPPARVGELIVKGTCHICHDATGQWPAPQEMLDGAIPPISGFTTKKSLPDLIWKVRHGAPVVMGSLRLRYRGRMPLFDYLSDDEVASAYQYLINYPP